MTPIATFDFHVTARCTQDCPYCWGPQDCPGEVDSEAAAAIVRKLAGAGARRIVFTGGDPMLRTDLGMLIRLARQEHLQVALSPTGDLLPWGFLRGYGRWIDLVSIPIDGPDEGVSSCTKARGHFGASMAALDLLAQFPSIDVKVATVVQRHNLAHIPALVEMIDRHAERMPNRLFYNLFQVFPRSMRPRDWDSLVVSDEEFAALRRRVESLPHRVQLHWLDRLTLDRVYVLVMPDGSLAVPSGSDYHVLGQLLDMKDIPAVVDQSELDATRHLQHSQGYVPAMLAASA